MPKTLFFIYISSYFTYLFSVVNTHSLGVGKTCLFLVGFFCGTLSLTDFLCVHHLPSPFSALRIGAWFSGPKLHKIGWSILFYFILNDAAQHPFDWLTKLILCLTYWPQAHFENTGLESNTGLQRINLKWMCHLKILPLFLLDTGISSFLIQ